MKNQQNSIEVELSALTPAELNINGGNETLTVGLVPIAFGGAIDPTTGETISILYEPAPGSARPYPGFRK